MPCPCTQRFLQVVLLNNVNGKVRSPVRDGVVVSLMGLAAWPPVCLSVLALPQHRWVQLERLVPLTPEPPRVSCAPRRAPLSAERAHVLSMSSRTAWRSLRLDNLTRAWIRTYQRGFQGFRRHRFVARPPVPPPNGTMLSVDTCSSMLANRSHVFRSFWGAPWLRMYPLCMPLESRQHMAEWAAEMEAGVTCDRNWFAGSPGGCVDQSVLPVFTRPAPAAIGFDNTLAERCADGLGPPIPAAHGEHKRACIERNYNVLSLFSAAPSYDMCRNLEWLVCAAKGALPGQRGEGIVADPPPQHVSLDVLWEQSMLRGAAGRYSPSAIYPLEVCALSALCANGAELFRLGEGEQFRCRLAPGALERFVLQMAEGYVGVGQDRIPTRISR